MYVQAAQVYIKRTKRFSFIKRLKEQQCFCLECCLSILVFKRYVNRMENQPDEYHHELNGEIEAEKTHLILMKSKHCHCRIQYLKRLNLLYI